MSPFPFSFSAMLLCVSLINAVEGLILLRNQVMMGYPPGAVLRASIILSGASGGWACADLIIDWVGDIK